MAQSITPPSDPTDLDVAVDDIVDYESLSAVIPDGTARVVVVRRADQIVLDVDAPFNLRIKSEDIIENHGPDAAHLL